MSDPAGTKTEAAIQLPDDGAAIQFRRKGRADWETGTVDFCWNACGCAAIDLVDGGTIIPELGDEWKSA